MYIIHLLLNFESKPIDAGRQLKYSDLPCCSPLEDALPFALRLARPHGAVSATKSPRSEDLGRIWRWRSVSKVMARQDNLMSSQFDASISTLVSCQVNRKFTCKSWTPPLFCFPVLVQQWIDRGFPENLTSDLSKVYLPDITSWNHTRDILICYLVEILHGDSQQSQAIVRSPLLPEHMQEC